MAISLSMDSPAMTTTSPPEQAADGRSAAETRLRHCFVLGLGGDAVQYRLFLHDLGPHLRGSLRRRLPRAHADVEYTPQETLLAVHTARHTYRNDQPLTA